MSDLVLNYLTTEVEIDFRKCQGDLTCTTMLPTWLVGTFFTTACRKIIKKCSGHSLNLVGRSAIDCCFNAVNYQWKLYPLFIFHYDMDSHKIILCNLSG